MKVGFVLLATASFFGCSLVSVSASEKGGVPVSCGTERTCSSPGKKLEENLCLFEKTMEPGYLDKALSVVKETPDRDDKKEILREVRSKKLKAMFRVFQAATDSINVRYIPEMARIFCKDKKQGMIHDDTVSPKVSSRYLYDYVQSGLRVFRFQTRLDILNYIRASYKGIPSQEERHELLAAAQGLDPEFVKLLSDFMKMDVSWKVDEKKRMPHHEDENKKEGLLQDMSSCMQHIQLLARSTDPLYLPDDCGAVDIPPPFPVSPDSVSLSGQSPDSIKNAESRKQYLIALNENSRKSDGAGIYRALEDQIKDMERAFFETLEKTELLDEVARRGIVESAEKMGMDFRFQENLKEACVIRTIDAAIKQFEITKDRKLIDPISLMLEIFHRCRNRAPGREILDNYQLGRWLMLFHAIDSDVKFKDDGELKTEMEEKIMTHIFKTYGKSRFSLQEARWSLKTYGMRKPLVERIDKYSRKLLEEEKREIEKRIASVEKTFDIKEFVSTKYLVERLTHKDYMRHKNIADILDYKIRCLFRLLALLESHIDLSYDTNPPEGISMKLPKSGLMLKTKQDPPSGEYDAGIQMRLREIFQDINYNLPYMIEYEYKEEEESQQRALKIVEKMNAKPHILKDLRLKFDRYNLQQSIYRLRTKNVGDPVSLLKEIKRVGKSDCFDPDEPFNILKNNISWEFNLLSAMEESGVHGEEGFEQKLRDGIMASIRNDVPDTWDGFLALDDIYRISEKTPLQAEIAKIREDRRNGNLRRFDEKLTAFEKTGDLLNLWNAMGCMNYIEISYSLNKEQKLREVYHEIIVWYLRLIKSVSKWTPEEFLNKQSSAPEQWGKGWSDQTTPKKRMELSLLHARDGLKSRLFSHLRGYCRNNPENKRVMMDTIRKFGAEPEFIKELESRLNE